MNPINKWLLENTNQLVAASNFTLSILMVMIAIGVSYSLFNIKFNNTTDIKYILVGVIMETLGWAFLSLYWGAWRFYLLEENEFMSQWFVTNCCLALLPIAMILIGITLILGPMLSFIINRGRWFCYGISAAFVVSLYWMVWWKLGNDDVAAKLKATAKIERSIKPVIIKDAIKKP